MTVTGFRPLRDFMTLRDAMDRFFEESFVSPGTFYNLTGNGGSGARYLPLDVYETPDEVVVRAQAPGVAPEGLDVNFQHGVLTLRANIEQPETQDSWRWYIHELSSGEVIRQLQLPRSVDVDHARASFENGILTLILPKSAEAKPKQIPIGSANNQIESGTQIESGDAS